MKVRYWLLGGALVLAVVAPKLLDQALINRAALLTTRAIYREADWSAAEQSWFQAMGSPEVAAQARDRVCRMYQAWFEAEPSATADVTELAHRANAASNPSDTLAYCADFFRAQGQLAVASIFYQAAFAHGTFSSAAGESAARFNASVTANKGTGNLVRNGDFASGLTDWRVTGQPGPQMTTGEVKLGCAGCQLEQEIPVMRAKFPSLYHLTMEARSSNSSDALQIQWFAVYGLAWSWQREISLSENWQSVSEWILYPEYGSPSLRMSLHQAGDSTVWVRDVRVEWADSIDNRLANASFDYEPASAGDNQFAPWRQADFWNNLQATGARKAVISNSSRQALEVRMTQAEGYPYHIGLQQACGELDPGARVELQADVYVPHDLQGAYAEVGGVIYSLADTPPPIFLGLVQRAATNGWETLRATAQAPPVAGRYRCVVITHLVAERPLTESQNVALFDNVILRAEEPAGLLR